MRKIKMLPWQRIFFMVLIAALVAGSDGCKSTGKLSRKEKKAQIVAAKKELQSIINGTSTKTLEQQELYINEIGNKHFGDAELDRLLGEATQKVKSGIIAKEKLHQERIDNARAELLDLLLNRDNKSADEMEKELINLKAKYKDLHEDEINDLYVRIEKKISGMRDNASNAPIKTQLETAFQSITDAGKNGNLTQAATVIKSTLPLFVSEETPVLIIINKEGAIIDYDKPTTIRRYLDFLKDQKKNPNNVDSYLLDNNGKIKELDLIKK